MALYDPKPKVASPDFSVEDVLAWARTKPADEGYQHLRANHCAVAQFGMATGRPHLVGLGFLSMEYPDLADAAYASPHTFGGLVKRLEALS